VSDTSNLGSSRQHRLPNQRWYIYPIQSEKAEILAQGTGLSLLLAQVLVNREIETPQEVELFLNPESLALPSPLDAFPDLAHSIELLEHAITQGEKIAICGDYDADGMTSTALLLRSLSALGAQVDYAIPSRMREGYGINNRIIEDFHQEGVSLIITVDNGISAHEPVAKARELGLKIIITDHHDLPPELPNANAILNPKLIPETSPYRGLAGVGVAYILAISLAQRLQKWQNLVNPLLELFTLGTIADLAPLTGVNRRWVKRGLRLLPNSKLAGIQALIHVSGVVKNQGTPDAYQFSIDTINPAKNTLKPEDIGFRLGPRINAVGRLDDPQIVIELLTTNDMQIALDLAEKCEKINQKRQELCAVIEGDAIALIEKNQVDLQADKVLVIVQKGWHHGVIGIVASRLVDRYGVPVFIGTYEEEEELTRDQITDETETLSVNLDEETLGELNPSSLAKTIRGSARGIPEFHVYEALLHCHDLLGKYGGHKAAGGFSLPTENLDAFKTRLREFARQCLDIECLKPLVAIDVQANFEEINSALYQEIDVIHPCGIENKDPIFWTPNVHIIEQKIVGKGHIKLTLKQEKTPYYLKAIAWRWEEYFPLPKRVDIAYKLRENTWKGNTTVELELIGVRLPISPEPPQIAEFNYRDRVYTCSVSKVGTIPELRIKNQEGQILAIQPGQKTGLLGTSRASAKEIDISKPFLKELIETAKKALMLS
jgi:single-stranded-DNA-specific exonuclease